jgi:hypothetical protein
LNDPELVRVYLQGAPEVIIGLCSFTLSSEERVVLGPQEKNLLLSQTVSQMAGSAEFPTGLKVFSYAFKDMELNELNKILN